MRRRWTPKEEAYLLSRYLNQPTEKTAKQINRSVTSVKRKAQKLGLNHYLDNIGARTVAKCFGCDVSVILRWIDKYGLSSEKIICKNQTRHVIDPVVFWQWASEHRTIINWSNYEEGSLVPQPEWVKEAIRTHTQHNSRKRYTLEEQSRITFLLKKQMPYVDIAKELGRSEESIKHVARKIRNSSKI